MINRANSIDAFAEGTETKRPEVFPAPVRVCVIDLGTNSFHAVLVDVHANGSFTLLDRVKEGVYLGAHGLSRHLLTEDAMNRAVAALQRIRMLAEGWGVEEYLGYATSAIREAENGGDLIERIREEIGLRIRTISGEMEARLIYQGVCRAVEMRQPALLVDIGGGSAEFIVATSKELFFATSLKLGAARMTEQFITTDPVDKEEFKALRAHYRRKLRPILAVAREYEVKQIVGSSGTLENIAQVYVNQSGDARRTIYQQDLDAVALRRLTKTLMKSPEAERRAMDGIDEKRVGQVVAGAALLDVLLKDLGVERVRISSNALREGMVVHFIQKNCRRLEQLEPYANARSRSVHELGYRCQWEERHARHVADLALSLFDACGSLHGLGKAERELLEYAALLHDIGYHISRRIHHKHALYLILNADLRGFQPEEIDIMAHVARYHRGGLPKEEHTLFQGLPSKTQQIIVKLAAFLGLAEGLDRSHFQNVQHLDVRLGKEILALRIKTQSDPQLDIWGTMRNAYQFKHIYGLGVDVKAIER